MKHLASVRNSSRETPSLRRRSNAANSVEMRLCNPTNVAFDGSAVTFQVLLIR